jgi:hypothetical protein
MSYISTPIEFRSEGLQVEIVRDLEDQIPMLNNLVELIVFTPKGSFVGDPDFGFEYWNHEYSNVPYQDFNSGHLGNGTKGLGKELTKQKCEDSIRLSLSTYAPQLKNVLISIQLTPAEELERPRKKAISKYAVNIVVEGDIDDGLGTLNRYRKCVEFLMEPTVKRFAI